MERVLYVSDLDGTLLRSDEKISEYSCNVINGLVEKGMIFSYATARSLNTASKVTEGLAAKMPLIIYNGAFIVDSKTKEKICTNFFNCNEVKEIFDIINNEKVSPIVYAVIDEKEKFSFIEEEHNYGKNFFLDSRKNDSRERKVTDNEELVKGQVFYFTCIDSEEKLLPVYEKFKEKYNCVYQKDIYSKAQWLEIMPKGATKAHAVMQLKEKLNIDKVVCFGDGINDIPMFEIADESYAVKNADMRLKKKAIGIIGDNNSDGVAKWLANNFKSDK